MVIHLRTGTKEANTTVLAQKRVFKKGHYAVTAFSKLEIGLGNL